MKLKQITVPIENSYHRLYEITKAFAGGGVAPRAFTLVDKGNYGELRILVSDIRTARQILMQKDIPGRVDEVVALEIENSSEHLPLIIKALMDADINIKYSYAYGGVAAGKSVMVFCFSDNEKAIRILNEKRIQALDYQAFGMLEAAA